MLIAYLMKERKKLEKIYQELNEGDTDIKRWNQALIPKAILSLFPLIANIVFWISYKNNQI